MGFRPAHILSLKNGVRAALASLVFVCAGALAAPRNNDIIIGSHVDLSGPLASWGASVKNGLVMAIEEANDAGGVNGRKLTLVVRDDSYDPEQAATAVRRFAGEGAFAILSPLGTPTVHAAMSEAEARGLLYLFPLTANEETYAPLAPLTFSLIPSHAMEIQEGLRRILNGRGALRVGVLASKDAFGREVAQGTINELKRRGLPLTADIGFAPEDTQFEDALGQLHAQGVDLIVLGTEAEQALQIARAAASLRWKPAFLCSSACYEPEFATLSGGEAEGFYAVSQVPIPYPEDLKLGAWSRRYEARFSAVANLHALAAYRNAHLFLAALAQAGENPTPAEFAHILETRGSWTDPVLGGLPVEFTATDHLGSHTSLLTQIRRGRWTVLADPIR
jgi:branched-chain amino acid transport system substrate-binding protein